MITNLKKVIAVVIAFTMISGALLVMVPSAGLSAEADALSIDDQIPMYAEPEVRERQAQDLSVPDVALPGEMPLVDNLAVNTTMDFWTQDMHYGNFYQESMTKRGEGAHCEVWVADDTSFPNPSDVRNFRVEITDDQVDYIIDEFDNNTYPIMTDTFIEAPELNGSNPDIWYWQYVYGDDNITEANITSELFPTNDTGKIMIMIFNIRDYNYYYSQSYVVGFYWSLISAMYDRNVIHIDCYDWVNRTTAYTDRPFLYESTIAHEYQHLLHDEMDPDEDSWINEGLSMMSEFLCGYGISYDHISWFLEWPDNSLTVWGDQDWIGPNNILADYGAVALFDLYLYDHYGGTEMLQAIFTSELQGIEGLNEAFLDMGFNRVSFDQVFRDWRIANLFTFGLEEYGNGLYNYDSISAWDVDSIFGVEIPAYIPFDRHIYVWGYSMEAYGTDYFNMYGLSDYYDPMTSKFVFDGDDGVVVGWEYIDEEVGSLAPAYPYYWWSGEGDQKDNLLTVDLNLSTPTDDGKHVLSMTTAWNIEEDWDYGFVQVSTDDGATWTSLDDMGDYCSDDPVPDAMPSIAENMPGLTGSSMGWKDLSFDLTAYADQEIMLGFRYMTDWGTSYDGWFIAQVSVDGEDVPLETMVTDPPLDVDFMVTIVVDTDAGYQIIDIPSMEVTEVAQRLLSSIIGYNNMYILISANNGPVNYGFHIESRSMYLV